MGNISFLFPTKNVEHFNPKSVEELIKKNFPKYETSLWEGKQVIVTHKDWNIIELWEDTCYMVTPEALQSDLSEGDDVQELIDINIWDMPCMGASNNSRYIDENNAILKFLHGYFGLYWLDEGIHPEFISPRYNFK